MPHRSSNPTPPALLLLLGLAVVAALVWGIFLLGGIEYAYRRIGIPEGAMFGPVFAELAAARSILGRLRELGRGMAAIGGAGTFDGVFPSGIVAVLAVSVR